MTPRDRIRTALSHREPDRLPLDFGGTDVTSLLAPAYVRLRRTIGLSGPIRLIDPAQLLPLIEDAILDYAGTDAKRLGFPLEHWVARDLLPGEICLVPRRNAPEKVGTDWVIRDQQGRVAMEMKPGGACFRQVRFPLADVERPTDLEHYRSEVEALDAPAAAAEDCGALAAEARRLRAESDRFLILNVGGHLFAGAQWLCGFEKFMVDLLSNRPLVEALLDRIVEVHIRRVERYAAAVGSLVDMVYVCDDLGTQAAPQLSPRLYREVIKPRHAAICRAIKKSFRGAFLMLHTDGAVRDFIPDFIEMGIDVLNPIQVSATGMDPLALKREFGRDIAFWGGGCDTQRVLPFGTPAEVQDEVRRRCDQLAPGGGFVFSHIHNIQGETPTENILAMLEAVHNYR